MILKPTNNTGLAVAEKDGRNALYSTEVEVDEDALEEYWVHIRNEPKKKSVRRFRATGKY